MAGWSPQRWGVNSHTVTVLVFIDYNTVQWPRLFCSRLWVFSCFVGRRVGESASGARGPISEGLGAHLHPQSLCVFIPRQYKQEKKTKKKNKNNRENQTRLSDAIKSRSQLIRDAVYRTHNPKQAHHPKHRQNGRYRRSVRHRGVRKGRHDVSLVVRARGGSGITGDAEKKKTKNQHPG